MRSGPGGLVMTTFEDAVSTAHSDTGTLPLTAPRVLTEPWATLVAPRITPTLERRRLWERRYRLRLLGSDVLAIGAAIGATSALQVAVGAMDGPTVRNAVVLAVFWILTLAGLRTRDASLIGSGTAEYRAVANAGGLAFALLAVTGVLLDWQDLRAALFLALPVGVLGMLIERWTWRRWLQRKRLEGEFTSRTLVVGEEEDVEYVISSLRSSGAYGYDVVGATLLDGRENGSGRLIVGNSSYRVLGTPDTVASAASEVGADTIVVASRPDGSPDFVKRLGWQLEGTAAELVLSSRLTDVAGPRISLRQVEGLPLIRVKIPTYEGGTHLLKRALDIAVALVALTPIALLTPLIALLIKIDSPGPIFFRQTRIGRDGTEFGMLKFRTMCTDAEERLAELAAQNEGAGVLFKMREDPRITRVGAILRKYSLDELPQFWNVLRGEMSVVGPRPPLPREVSEYAGAVHRRMYIKPGITGLWQVSGRSDLSWDESVRLDLRYVENWSVINDLQIMWRTAKVMLKPSGAY